MKGLLIKDFINLKKQGKVMLALIIFYIAFAIFEKNTGILNAIIVLVAILMPVTSLAYDERDKWNRYALSMPVSRRQLVGSKYVLGMGTCVVGAILVFLLSLAVEPLMVESSVSQMFLISYGVCVIGILLLSLFLPLLLKFGVEKGRLVMVCCFVVIFAVLAIFPELEENILPERWLLLGSPFITAAVAFLSYRLSVHIYQKKEF